MVHIILIHLSTFTAKTASAINTLPFSYLVAFYKAVFVGFGLAYFTKVKAKEDV